MHDFSLLEIEQVIGCAKHFLHFWRMFLNIIKTSRNITAYNSFYSSSIHDNFLFLWRKNEEPAHTIIVTGWDASCRPTSCHNSCSYLILVPIEITDVNGDRELKMYVLTKSCLLQ